MSSKESFSWLGDPNVCLMSEDGHRVMTHRPVLGLYSSSFRHLLSINPADGETCMIICHDMSFIQLKELVDIANLNFPKITIEEYQKKIVLGNKTKLETISDTPLTKQFSPQKETLTVTEQEIDGPPLNYNLESSIDLTSISGDFKSDIENTTNGEKKSLTPRNNIKWINIEEVNICTDKTSEAYKEFKSLDQYAEFNPETKRIDCKLCDKTYEKRHPIQIKYHIDSVHMEKYLSCRFCRKEFFSLVSFMHHYRNHLSMEKFRCEECGINAGSKLGLSRHKASVHLDLHENSFKCTLCDNSYASKFGLLNHTQSKHKVDKNKFPCSYCNHESITESSLILHKKLKHENVKSYLCKDCDYVCHRSDYLRRHISSIHENVRHQCHQCEYQATRKQYLESHIKKIHQKEDSTPDSFHTAECEKIKLEA